MFKALDYDEQTKRLSALAREALDAFDLPNARFELAAYTNNAVYHVVDSGARYVKEAHYALRIHRPGLKKREWIESELLWLTDIRWRTPLNVPEPAAPVYVGTLEGIESPVYCTLFGWVYGQAARAAYELTTERVYAIGQFIARLHQHSLHYELPDGFERPRLDVQSLFGKSSADGTPSPYFSLAEDEFFTLQQQRTILRTRQHVEMVVESLDHDWDTFGLIHGDLIINNILFTAENEVGAIDFDDCAFGYYLYDLVPLLWWCRDEPNYAHIRNTLWESYTSILPQPQHHGVHLLDALLAARHVASCRWIAGNADHPDIRGKARDIIAQRVAELERFFETGYIG